MFKRNTYIMLTVLVLAFLVYIFFFTNILGADEVEVADKFDDKIVYTTEIGLDPEPFKAHCIEQGGLFNACGSPCPTADTGVCASVCAYTCEDL